MVIKRILNDYNPDFNFNQFVTYATNHLSSKCHGILNTDVFEVLKDVYGYAFPNIQPELVDDQDVPTSWDEFDRILSRRYKAFMQRYDSVFAQLANVDTHLNGDVSIGATGHNEGSTTYGRTTTDDGTIGYGQTTTNIAHNSDTQYGNGINSTVLGGTTTALGQNKTDIDDTVTQGGMDTTHNTSVNGGTDSSENDYSSDKTIKDNRRNLDIIVRRMGLVGFDELVAKYFRGDFWL